MKIHGILFRFILESFFLDAFQYGTDVDIHTR